MARKRRDLTPEEAELWGRIKRTAVPLRPERPEERPRNDPTAPDPTGPPARPSAPAADLSGLSIGGAAPPSTPRPPSGSARHALRMDSKAYDRMRRGKLSVEARIDLHGLTLAEAHPRLISFVLSSHGAGRRLVLVITGKGRDRDDGDPIPMRRGALRRQVPHWLSSGPQAGVVLQVTEAHRRHGGSGAFYVYLRRK